VGDQREERRDAKETARDVDGVLRAGEKGWADGEANEGNRKEKETDLENWRFTETDPEKEHRQECLCYPNREA
jgi:hypothetical protein